MVIFYRSICQGSHVITSIVFALFGLILAPIVVGIRCIVL